MTDPLEAALERLRDFRATFNDGDAVDEESGLTAADLSAIISAVEIHTWEKMLVNGSSGSSGSLSPQQAKQRVSNDDLLDLVVTLSDYVTRITQVMIARTAKSGDVIDQALIGDFSGAAEAHIAAMKRVKSGLPSS
jgi:hypothetical protein